MTVALDIVLPRGNSYAMLVDLLDEDGDPLLEADLEHASTRFRWTLTTSAGAAALSLTLGDGITLIDQAGSAPHQLLVSLTSAQSAALDVRVYAHELKIKLPDGVVDTLVSGRFAVTASVIGADV